MACPCHAWTDLVAVTFINTSDPYNDPLSPELDGMSGTPTQSSPSFDHHPNGAWPSTDNIQQSNGMPSTHGLQALSAAATREHLEYMSHNGPHRSSILAHTDHLHSPTPSISTMEPPISPPVSISNHNINFILNHPAASSPPIDPNLQSPFTPSEGFTHRVSLTHHPQVCPHIEADAEEAHEIAFLLRHFSEGPGYWMDLFDLGTYFASYVPVKALGNPLLKYAAVAYAAKALGRVQGKKPIMGGNVSRQARMELYPDALSIDWYHKAAEYYDTAVSLLRQTLQDDSNHTPEEPIETEHVWSGIQVNDDHTSCKRRRVSSTTGHKPNSDELLAATAILCVYEFLDASVPEWSRHLNGAKSLLDIAKERMMPLQLPSPGTPLLSPSSTRMSKARKATFWNIARQDMLAACR